MKRIVFIIALILVGAVCWGQENNNSGLIREIFENKNQTGYGRYEQYNYYNRKTYYCINYIEIGLLYVAGCNPEYLEKYGKGYKIKDVKYIYGDYVVTGGNFGTPVKFARTARRVKEEIDADSEYNSILADIGHALEFLYKHEDGELNEKQINDIKIKHWQINNCLNKIRKINRKAYKEKEKVKVGQLF